MECVNGEILYMRQQGFYRIPTPNNLMRSSTKLSSPWYYFCLDSRIFKINITIDSEWTVQSRIATKRLILLRLHNTSPNNLIEGKISLSKQIKVTIYVLLTFISHKLVLLLTVNSQLFLTHAQYSSTLVAHLLHSFFSTLIFHCL